MSGRTGRPPVHDWSTILDGEAHVLVRGVDYQCKEVSLRTLIYRTATASGKRAQVRIGTGANGVSEGECLVVARDRTP